ncbi:lytic murein transglycosylase [Oharaeibacter diazotrophicus]|uniref:Lytic murein transglycosylase n=2 Tax=Oharaeibacter diazotrophicus TaxID=1920512 RepID=A0A4R6R9U5_9HYPH|nr:lytic murein transglycosylase [Oharaeibacter diazotrophicus]TDP82387.1 lytic murein transglycosylase [Oharaeibacter diazotrophicus]BBE72850.1 membrane-bound lytic murein transglycosylase B precursor [Pleomorphomonas sp. SM30]GLS76889.1 lytic transglycosylase [Oharaeibacter diazotrophicus]
MPAARPARRLAILAAALVAAGPASAACRAGADGFGPWLESYKAEAVAAGVPASVVASALAGVSYDPAVIKKDRGQGVFSQTFLEFSTRMVEGYRVKAGLQQIAKNRALFDRIEATYGVPAEVLVGVWGLESDFGANTGSMATLDALATLAFDCRRPDRFRPELTAALEIVAAGDLTPAEMRGAWAGELGQTQFLPSNYVKYAVDFDGDGRRDLIRSKADVLASTANYLKSLGWQQGAPWLVEVRVPASMNWGEAHLAAKKSAAAWQAEGVSPAHGAIPAGEASLYLPMGRNGPAFLAYHNFDVYLGWNESLVYSTTAAYYATRLAGAPRVGQGNGPVDVLGAADIKAIQQALANRGLDPGPIDGKLGSRTREAVRAVQIQLGLPADGWPDHALLRAM